jgi:hypothetical protein
MKLNSTLPYIYDEVYNNRIKPSKIYTNPSKPTTKEGGGLMGDEENSTLYGIRLQRVVIRFSEIISGFY